MYGAPSCGCDCGTAYPPVFTAPAPVYNTPAPVYSAPAPVYSAPAPVFSAPAPVFGASSCGLSGGHALEEGCCPGPVVEKKSIITKPITVPYSYSEPTYSKQCFQRPAGVDRKVIPSAYETAPTCETLETVVKVPTTDVHVQEQPLVRKTCTTSEYIIQIPIVETTCTSAPLCKKTVRTQDNVLTTVSKKTSCAKQLCTQNKVVDQPFTETVCQDYQGSITKTGAKTVLKPEVVKSCFQLPPRKCLKPATGPGVFLDYGNGRVPYDGGYNGGYDGAFVAGGAVIGDAVAYGADAFAPGYYGAGPAVAEVFAPASPCYGSAPVFAEAFAPATGYCGSAPEAVVSNVLPTSYLGCASGPVCSCAA